MQQPPSDFPPVPRCFTHLISRGEGDGRGSRIKSVNTDDGMQTTLSPKCKMSLEVKVHSSKLDHSSTNGQPASRSNNETCLEERKQQSSRKVSEDVAKHFSSSHSRSPNEMKEKKSPYIRLNSSLKKLQNEMRDLREMDMSLFSQLMSLHESIQDLKVTMCDHYSETGSEYSLGTASHMGSMSSLNDESDWAEDSLALNSLDGFDTQKFADALKDLDENYQSTSSLLKQITDLAMRADQDF